MSTNPPIPENSKHFRHHDEWGDQVFLPVFASSEPYQAEWVSIDLVAKNSAWRPWVAARAVEDLDQEVSALYLEDVDEEDDFFDGWEEALEAKHAAIDAWREWGAE